MQPLKRPSSHPSLIGDLTPSPQPKRQKTDKAVIHQVTQIASTLEGMDIDTDPKKQQVAIKKINPEFLKTFGQYVINNIKTRIANF